MADTVNFNVIQGDNFQLNIFYKDSEGQPINLTNYNVKCEVRDSFGGKISCATAVPGDGITITPSTGKIAIDFVASKTIKFTVPKAVWQVQLIYPDGVTKKTIASGYLNVGKAAVTYVG